MKTKLQKRLGLSLLAGILSLGFGSASAQCNANFTYSTAPGGNGGIMFFGISTGTTSTTHYYWSFGDMTYDYTNPSPTHTYNANGVYTVQLQIADSSTVPQCFSSFTQTIGITNIPCSSVNFNFTHVTYPNNSVSFMGNLSGGYSYSWSFGDGSYGTGQSPSHTYSAAGVYTVVTSVTNPSTSCTYTATNVVQVNASPCNLTGNFSATVGSGGVVSFVSTSTGTSANTTYNWAFGDGTYASPGTSGSVTHTYTSNGVFIVHMYLSDSVGTVPCYASYTSTISVSGASCIPNASFNMVRDSTTTLNWLAYVNYPSTIASATWNWGDGTSSTGLYPSHTYSAAGFYTICLYYSMSCGSTGTVCSLNYVYKGSSNNSILTVHVVNSGGLVTGIAAQSADKGIISISPNPNDSHFTLNIQGAESGKSVEIRVMNLLGETVYAESDLSSGSSYSKTLDLKNVAAGTYFIKVSAGSKAYQSKMIISK